MMERSVNEIMISQLKHKEQVALLTDKATHDDNTLAQMFEILEKGSDVQKGTAAEVFKFV